MSILLLIPCLLFLKVWLVPFVYENFTKYRNAALESLTSWSKFASNNFQQTKNIGARVPQRRPKSVQAGPPELSKNRSRTKTRRSLNSASKWRPNRIPNLKVLLIWGDMFQCFRINFGMDFWCFLRWFGDQFWHQFYDLFGFFEYDLKPADSCKCTRRLHGNMDFEVLAPHPYVICMLFSLFPC